MSTATMLVATRGKRAGGQISSHRYIRLDDAWVGVGWNGGGGEDRALPSRSDPDESWFRTEGAGTGVDQASKRLLQSRRVHNLVVQVAEGVAEGSVERPP